MRSPYEAPRRVVTSINNRGRHGERTARPWRSDRADAFTTQKPDISGIMGDIETLLDESIIGHAIRAPITDDFTELFDLRAIDFNKLSAAFRKGQKRTQVQMLRAKVEQKLGEMIRRNPTHADLLEKFQSMIAEYNAGSASVDQLFEQLLAFIRSMSEEEQRATREGLDEEELAIFDLLTQPEPKLTEAQEVAFKRIARTLLAKLKREKPDPRLAAQRERQGGCASDYPRGIRRPPRGLRPAAMGGEGRANLPVHVRALSRRHRHAANVTRQHTARTRLSPLKPEGPDLAPSR
jgi:hypothetical protein